MVVVAEKVPPDFVLPLESIAATEGDVINFEGRVKGSPKPDVRIYSFGFFYFPLPHSENRTQVLMVESSECGFESLASLLCSLARHHVGVYG